MRTKVTTVVCIVVMCLCLFLLHLVSAFQLDNAEVGFSGLLQLRLPDSPVEATNISGITEDKWLAAKDEMTPPSEVPLYTAWTQKNGVLLENERTGVDFTAEVIYYCGDNSARFHLIRENGCAIPEEAAFALWGTKEILGQSLVIDGRRFVVEQVLEEGSWNARWSGGAAIARWTAEAGSTMDFDVLDIDRRGTAVSIEELSVGQGLKSAASIDYDQRILQIHALRTLPLWGAAVLAAFQMLSGAKKGWKRLGALVAYYGQEASWPEETVHRIRRELLRAAGIVLCSVLGAVALFWIVAVVFGPPVAIPDWLLPSSWSDFSFWADAAARGEKTFHILNSISVYGPDAYFKGAFAVSVCTSVLQTVVLCASIIVGWRKRNGCHRIETRCKEI